MTEAEKAAADKAAADKAAADKALNKAQVDNAATDKATAERSAAATKGASVEGARSVAEAVRRVADAAVAEIQKVGGIDKGDFVSSGTAGGKFTIDGPVGSFGTNGTVTLNGVQLDTRGWGSMHIEGNLPKDAKTGELVVHVDAETTKRGLLTL